MEIRPYEPGDEQHILQLFKLAFGRGLDTEFWKWRFIDNPVDSSRTFIHLMWDGPVLAGHYAVSPVRMNIAGKVRHTALSMTTMTHPDYAGRGIFTQLAESVYDVLRRAGYYMVWGFPNQNSHYGFVRRLNWADVYQQPMLRLVPSALRRAPALSRRIQLVERFDDDVNQLLEAALPKDGVWVVRDNEYLNWRYVAEPTRRYTILGLREEGQLKGYAVVKLYSNDTQLEGDIVDFLAHPDEGLYEELVAHSLRLLFDRGATAVNMWFNAYHPLHSVFERWGFRLAAPVIWLGARPLNEDDSGNALDYKCWYITMGDSDVF